MKEFSSPHQPQSLATHTNTCDSQPLAQQRVPFRTIDTRTAQLVILYRDEDDYEMKVVVSGWTLLAMYYPTCEQSSFT